MSILRKPFGNLSKTRLEQWEYFVSTEGICIDEKGINPKHIIQWVNKLIMFEGFNIFDSCKFKNTFYYLMKDSKYPMTLFLKFSHVEKLMRNCHCIDVEILEQIFRLFLKASKLYSTDTKGRHKIRSLPLELLENKEEFKGWFLTDVNDCFRMSCVIDFYIWLDSQTIKPNFTIPEQVSLLISKYLPYMKETYTKPKYKKKRLFLAYTNRLIGQNHSSLNKFDTRQ